MPRKDPSPPKQPPSKQNQQPQPHPDYPQRQSPSNQAQQYQQQDQSHHQSTPSRNYPKQKVQKTDSKGQPGSRPPKYQSSNPGSDQNSNRQSPAISRIREQNIDIQGSNQSRKMEKVPYSKQPKQSTKQVGKLLAHINHSRQPSEDQPKANTPQERKIKDLHANMQKLSESLLDLRENYENFEKQEIKYSNLKNSQIYDSKHTKIDHNKNNSLVRYHSQSLMEKTSKNSVEEALSKSRVAPRSNQEVLQFLLEKQREKEERKKKMAIISEQSRKKIEEELMQRNKREEQYLNWRRSQIRAAHNFEQKHKQQKEIEQNRKKAAEEYAKQIKDKKYNKYILKKQQLQQKMQKEFEEKREKIVNQRKQLHKPLDSQEIEQHQKWFEAKREELLQQKRMLRQDSLERIEEGNSNLPEFWKGNAHQIAQAERIRIKEKLKQPHEKAQKRKAYKEYIHEKFKAKSPKQPQQNLLNIFDPSRFKEIKRYRYYKGVSYGQIVETAPVAKDAKEIMRIGNSNMQLMKKVSKKRNLSTQIYSATPQPQRKFDMNLVRNIFSSVVEKQKAKALKIQLPQNLKCHQLQAVVDKIHCQSVILYDKEKYLSREGNKNGRNKQEEKELLDNLVNNIELKLNLLSQL